jgi:hypothetical protein
VRHHDHYGGHLSHDFLSERRSADAPLIERTPAGFGSEQVAGFTLECMAGFVGIRTLSQAAPYQL